MANSNNQSQTYIDPNYATQMQESDNLEQANDDNQQDLGVDNNQSYNEQTSEDNIQYNHQPKSKQYDNLYQQYNQSYWQTGEYFPKKRPIFRWEQEYLKNDSMNFEDSEFYNLLHFDQIQNQVSSSNNDDFSDLVEETPN